MTAVLDAGSTRASDSDHGHAAAVVEGAARAAEPWRVRRSWTGTDHLPFRGRLLRARPRADHRAR